MQYSAVMCHMHEWISMKTEVLIGSREEETYDNSRNDKIKRRSIAMCKAVVRIIKENETRSIKLIS